jgi:transcriptional accessory protein Tex/SPT6
MTSYGVFVDIGGVDGMVHISELSWSRIKNPAEVCKVGDTPWMSMSFPLTLTRSASLWV